MGDWKREYRYNRLTLTLFFDGAKRVKWDIYYWFWSKFIKERNDCEYNLYDYNFQKHLLVDGIKNLDDVPGTVRGFCIYFIKFLQLYSVFNLVTRCVQYGWACTVLFSGTGTCTIGSTRKLTNPVQIPTQTERQPATQCHHVYTRVVKITSEAVPVH